MKQIEFGFANEMNPTGSWEGIGIKKGLLLTDAEYYGAIKFENNSYIVAKVTEDKYNRYPDLLDKFIVRPAIADMYVDGSGCLFLDQEESLVSQKIQRILNSPEVIGKVSNLNDIKNFLPNVYPADRSFTFITMDEKVTATSINHEAFEMKNNALKNCSSSFSQLQTQIQEMSNGYNR